MTLTHCLHLQEIFSPFARFSLVTGNFRPAAKKPPKVEKGKRLAKQHECGKYHPKELGSARTATKNNARKSFPANKLSNRAPDRRSALCENAFPLHELENFTESTRVQRKLHGFRFFETFSFFCDIFFICTTSALHNVRNNASSPSL